MRGPFAAGAAILLGAFRWGIPQRRQRGAPSFRARARWRGLDGRTARLLEGPAREIAPDRPERVLHDRELFEQTALAALCGPGTAIGLHEGAELFARALERLALARTSDLPDPLRRVMLRVAGAPPELAIVLANTGAELLLAAPATDRPLERGGAPPRLVHSARDSLVEIPVHLAEELRSSSDRLIRLRRCGGGESFGRAHRRRPVLLAGKLRPGQASESEECAWPVQVFDLGPGGAGLGCARELEPGGELDLELALEDGDPTPLALPSQVAWCRLDEERRWRCGLRFANLADREARRLQRFLLALEAPWRPSASPPGKREKPELTLAATPA